MKILVADDEHNLRKVLVSELSEEGHEVSGVDNGVTALALLEHEEYDVVILDLNMPSLGESMSSGNSGHSIPLPRLSFLPEMRQFPLL